MDVTPADGSAVHSGAVTDSGGVRARVGSDFKEDDPVVFDDCHWHHVDFLSEEFF